MKKYKFKKGYSLLELMLVLVIAASLVIGAFYIYDKIKIHYEAQTLSTKLSEIIANYRALEVSSTHMNDKHTNNAALNDYLVGNILKKTSDNNYMFEGNTITLNNMYTGWAFKSADYTTASFSMTLMTNADICTSFAYSFLQQKEAVVDLITSTYASPGTNYPPSETGITTSFTPGDITKSCQIFDSIHVGLITITVYG